MGTWEDLRVSMDGGPTVTGRGWDFMQAYRKDTQHLVPIFRNPDKVILNLVDRMTAVAIIHPVGPSQMNLGYFTVPA